MTQVVLEIQSGSAVGVIHRPMAPHALTDTTLESETACGLLGYVYEFAGLIPMRLPACPECRVAVGRRKRPAPLDRSPRPCIECGHDFTPRRQSTRATRFCSNKCKHRDFYRRNREALRAYNREAMRRRRAA